MPQACTLMRTSPALGFGISRSTISNSPPALEICATFIGTTAILVVAISPPSTSNLAETASLQLLRADLFLDGLGNRIGHWLPIPAACAARRRLIGYVLCPFHSRS